jgi:hypothetical protein
MEGGSVHRGNVHYLVMQRAQAKQRLALEQARESKSHAILIRKTGDWEERVPGSYGDDDDLGKNPITGINAAHYGQILPHRL